MSRNVAVPENAGGTLAIRHLLANLRERARVRARARALVTRARLRTAGRDLHVEFTNPAIGFFAQMNFCLYAARYAEMTGRRVFITLSSPNYRDPEHGPNWFHYFFEERHGVVAPTGRRRIRVADNAELPSEAQAIDLEQAHDLFFRHYAIRPQVVSLVESEARRLGVGGATLGVHFRGTDKHLEAESVERATAIAKIAGVLDADRTIDRVFVASDDAGFIRMIRGEIRSVPVASLEDSVRSEGSEPIHLSGLRPGNRAMARDALLNALMLARCGRLVRTTSFLSA